jgi:hypothetical protein
MTLADKIEGLRRHSAAIAIAAYATVAVVTFGHSAADEPLECPERAIYCTRSDMQMRAVAGGLLAGVTWPLYWSWEIALRAREAGNG